ncbi:hypothetical protein [Roseomonas sp. AR75]|uniref:hypothetical protein n=1 Tax=Roseomonas sp. AR75 TaxID=2562311 RepID=UPI0010C06F8C|nr:hypothetical protein [Roseomonas sp. AR75]
MAAEIEIVWLIDGDPPSPLGGRAFYPETPGAPPPDATLMAARFAAMREAVAEAGAPAVVTLHTSPRHRRDFFDPPYADEWRSCLDRGMALALHPHEDLADGKNRYGDADHITGVIVDCMAMARRADLPIAAFRSGSFAWNAALPTLLDRMGIGLDLSPGPGLRMPEKHVDWPAEPDAHRYRCTQLFAVPIGWNGTGTDLDRDYLFLERMDFARLAAVWDAIRARVQRRGQPARCNLLTHGFGLADPHWRALALQFIDHLRAHGGRVISAEQAMEPLHAHHA